MAALVNKLRILTIFLSGVIVVLLAWRVMLFRQPRRAMIELRPMDYGKVSDFNFTDQSGRLFGLHDLKGNVWVADFFFTQCMGPCPTLTTKMARLQKEFATSSNLKFVSFSVDPDHDTPAVLTKYAQTHGADLNRWTFLTGSKEKIFKLIRESFHLAVESKPGQNPSIHDVLHSLYFVLVDKDGKIIGYYNSSDWDALDELRARIKNV